MCRGCLSCRGADDRPAAGPRVGFEWEVRAALEGLIDPKTLCFRDAQSEHGFLALREASLATNMFWVFTLMFLYSTAVTCHAWIAPDTSGGNFKTEEHTRRMVFMRNDVLLVVTLVCSIGMGTARLQRNFSLFGPRAFEFLCLGLFLVLILGVSAVQPWYWSRLFRVGRDMVTSLSALDDANFILMLDGILTLMHLMLPMRWVAMWPVEVGAVLAYGFFAAFLGSPMEFKNVLYKSLAICMLSLAACIGKRNIELHERTAFAGAHEARGGRADAGPGHAPGPGSRSLGLRGPPRTREPRRRPLCRQRQVRGHERLRAALGGRRPAAGAGALLHSAVGFDEHWLIPAADVQPHPEHIVGFGSFGFVMAASFHGADVVLKAPLVPYGDSNGLQSMTALMHELRMLRRLRHPNIVLFYGACVVPETEDLLLVLEHVRGTTLSAFVRPPPEDPPAGVRCKLADDVCCALRYLHARQVVHGDVKDRNALVERQGLGSVSVKLVDFGLSRLLSRTPRPMGGTIHWMAPEVMLGTQREPSPNADVFSFGRLLYMIVTGCRPMPREEILRQAESGRVPILKWGREPLVEECRPICDTCCHVDPARRPSISEVQRTLSERLGHLCDAWSCNSEADDAAGPPTVRRVDEALHEARSKVQCLLANEAHQNLEANVGALGERRLATSSEGMTWGSTDRAMENSFPGEAGPMQAPSGHKVAISL
eukprot:CAMPEP_0177292458 /NCGR_PEP_ID=MMETSP0368-20130122/187_1 /TAXON_ID=447022 ORGANISM="Scrippsiella hangoei-like, Strain SHHI-4" /NCGR_SAMPLE_ID=MMETSP0368 /ASSEMBLY_ACC=CAM_ASM_000363 /LENGTH=710 /DNA_ID=CAMNT_0018750093 /DNA_START=1 /DNA_END=2133 /DNA_ORIENTATION=-